MGELATRSFLGVNFFMNATNHQHGARKKNQLSSINLSRRNIVARNKDYVRQNTSHLEFSGTWTKITQALLQKSPLVRKEDPDKKAHLLLQKLVDDYPTSAHKTDRTNKKSKGFFRVQHLTELQKRIHATESCPTYFFLLHVSRPERTQKMCVNSRGS